MSNPEKYKTYSCCIWVQVWDPELLRQAAVAHPDNSDIGDDFLGEDGEILVDDCLVMLLDPGVSPPGCEILESTAEPLEVL